MRAILCYGDLNIKMLLSDPKNRRSRQDTHRAQERVAQSHGRRASTYPCGLDAAKDSLNDGFYNVAEASLYSSFKQPADTKTASVLGLKRPGAPRFSMSAKHELSSY
jgi:predicted negative regulator of RcsB-dependent stress response